MFSHTIRCVLTICLLNASSFYVTADTVPFTHSIVVPILSDNSEESSTVIGADDDKTEQKTVKISGSIDLDKSPDIAHLDLKENTTYSLKKIFDTYEKEYKVSLKQKQPTPHHDQHQHNPWGGGSGSGFAQHIQQAATSYKEKKEKDAVIIHGTIDISSIPMKSLASVNLQSLSFSAKLSKKRGIKITITLPKINVGVGGNLENGTIDISNNKLSDSSKTTSKITLNGSGHVKLMGETVSTKYKSTYEKGNLPITTLIPTKSNLAKLFKISTPSITLKNDAILKADPKKHSYSITGVASVGGLATLLQLKGGEKYIKLTAKIATDESKIMKAATSQTAQDFEKYSAGKISLSDAAKIIPEANKIANMIAQVQEKTYLMTSASIGALKYGLGTREGAVWIEGDGEIAGIPVSSKLTYEKNDEGKGALLIGSINKKLVLSDIAHKLKDTPFANTGIKNVTLLISTFDFTAEKSNIFDKEFSPYLSKNTLSFLSIKEGLDFIGLMNLADLSKWNKLSSWIKEDKSFIKTSLYFNPAGIFILSGNIGDIAKIPHSPVQGGQIGTFAGEKDNNFVAGYSLDVLFAPDFTQPNMTLQLTSMADVSEQGLDLEGSIKGTWSNPYGLPGVSIGNLAGTIGIGWEGIPYQIGLAGNLSLGSFTADTALLLSDDDILISIKRDNMSTDDFIEIYNAIAQAVNSGVFYPSKQEVHSATLSHEKSSKNKKSSKEPIFKVPTSMKMKTIDPNKLHLPYILVRNLDCYIAPETVEVGRVIYEKGFNIHGSLYVLKKTPPADLRNEKSKSDQLKAFAEKHKWFMGDAQVKLDEEGIKSKFYANKLEIKAGDLTIFELTGKGPDKKLGTDDDGPELEMELDFANPHVYGSGIIKMPGVKAESYIDISSAGFSFEIDDGLYGVNGKIKGKLIGNLASPDIQITLEVDTKSFEYNIIEGIKYTATQLGTGASTTSTLQQQLSELKQKLAAAKKKAGEQYDGELNRAQSQAKKLESQISNLKNKLSKGK